MPRPTGQQFIQLLDDEGRQRSFKALYHGTRAELNEGDELSPEYSTRSDRRLTFATPSLAAAKRFSKDTEGNFGHVYQVEPVDSEDTNATWARPMRYYTPKTTEVVSSKGFRVVKRVFPK